MDTFARWTIIGLSLQIMFTSIMWMRAEKKVSYYVGRESVYKEFTFDPEEFTHYGKQPKPLTKKSTPLH